MPTYTMRNRESGEEQTLILTFSEREKWLNDNPDWDQSLSTPLLVREAKGALALSPDSWKDHLKTMKKNSGRNNKIHT
jgi:hypothetical protein